MKYILSIISSTRTMAVLLFIFAFSIAAATFIEKNAGTEAAQSLIYHAKWFELLFFLGIINIIAVTVTHKIVPERKTYGSVISSVFCCNYPRCCFYEILWQGRRYAHPGGTENQPMDYLAKFCQCMDYCKGK